MLKKKEKRKKKRINATSKSNVPKKLAVPEAYIVLLPAVEPVA